MQVFKICQDWIAPSFIADSVQRVVTFRFPAESGAGRACLFSVLLRFEYFQKALENWQEGASAEVVVTDATTQTFDLLLRYFHTGSLDSELTLESLVALLELSNKYLLSHLMALCMTKILSAPAALVQFFTRKPVVQRPIRHPVTCSSCLLVPATCFRTGIANTLTSAINFASPLLEMDRWQSRIQYRSRIKCNFPAF